jgi:hypothetical protein
MFALYLFTSFFTIESHEQAVSFPLNNVAILPQILDAKSLVGSNGPFAGKQVHTKNSLNGRKSSLCPFGLSSFVLPIVACSKI